MQAAVFSAPQRLDVRQVPDPELPADGLLLEVRACGVCGSDLRRWREGPPPGAATIIPGHEIAGTVLAVGPATSDYAVGDRLALATDIHCGHCYYCRRGLYNLCDDLKLLGITPGYPGGFAEQMAVSRQVLRDGIVHRIPEGLSDVGAALAEPLASVLACHAKTGTTMGDGVVVIGAGPIGCLHIAVARARGARVIVSQRSAARRDLAARFRPDLIVDPTEQDLVAAVCDYTGGLGADIAICANPVADTQAQAVELVRKGGQVVLFGGLPKADPYARLDANRIHYGELRVIGSFSYHPTHHEAALAVLARGLVRVDDIVTHHFGLDDAQAAFEAAASGAALKVMVQG